MTLQHVFDIITLSLSFCKDTLKAFDDFKNKQKLYGVMVFDM